MISEWFVANHTENVFRRINCTVITQFKSKIIRYTTKNNYNFFVSGQKFTIFFLLNAVRTVLNNAIYSLSTSPSVLERYSRSKLKAVLNCSKFWTFLHSQISSYYYFTNQTATISLKHNLIRRRNNKGVRWLPLKHWTVRKLSEKLLLLGKLSFPHTKFRP